MPNRDGLLVVVSGPAGSGKSTLVENLIATIPGNARRAVTATTRAPRPGEKDQVDYFFLVRDEFLRMVDEGDFLEYTEFNGNLYGVLRRALEKELSRGGVVLLVIEVDGAESVKFFFPDAIFVFIVPPTPFALRRRLEGRGTESPADIEKRLGIAEREMQRIGEYDFLIINDRLETATQDLAAVIRAVERSLIFGGEMERWEAGQFANWSTRRFYV
ncbi:MAG: guanylate kinase [Planctomycetota bacterium]|jgi:guanylate kinase|nr:guanylate kinase [Planctomycetota bacterium]